MAVTITRTAWIDDDGSGTYGTVINNAEKTLLYNQIDAALAQLAVLNSANTFTGNQTINGTLTVVGTGGSQFAGSNSSGPVSVAVQNTAAGTGAWAGMTFGNDVSGALMVIGNYSSTYASAAYNQQNGSTIYTTGPGGFSLAVTNAAALRFYTNGAERMRLAPTGDLLIGTTSIPAQCGLGVLTDASVKVPIAVQSSYAGATGALVAFYNYGNGLAGSISMTSTVGVAYNTSSDARLKDDHGRATDLSALRGVVVHDFTWKGDGVRSRGVFAQEAAAVFPRAISEGDDDLTDGGDLAHPWMTDYSKFVPDLIVGWQQHEATIAALRAELLALKGQN
jgi:Chaperone of endosialidase